MVGQGEGLWVALYIQNVKCKLVVIILAVYWLNNRVISVFGVRHRRYSLRLVMFKPWLAVEETGGVCL